MLCYDGASNMRGRYFGLAARVHEVEKGAIYIHCHAHQLNLALQSACCAVIEMSEMFLVQYLHCIIFWKVVLNDIQS